MPYREVWWQHQPDLAQCQSSNRCCQTVDGSLFHECNVPRSVQTTHVGQLDNTGRHGAGLGRDVEPSAVGIPR